jgi:hypothetical protein
MVPTIESRRGIMEEVTKKATTKTGSKVHLSHSMTRRIAFEAALLNRSAIQ